MIEQDMYLNRAHHIKTKFQVKEKEVDIKDYSKAAAVGQILKDLEFPTDKKKIIKYAERAKPQSEEILSDLRKIEERQYKNISDVAKAAELVRH
jgi:hypothetical protein